MQSESEALQKMGLVKYGMIFQGASYEGLTCNFTEFLTDVGGSVLNSSSTAAAEFTLPYGLIFAGSVVAILPIVIIVLIFKRNVISGLTAGAIKEPRPRHEP